MTFRDVLLELQDSQALIYWGLKSSATLRTGRVLLVGVDFVQFSLISETGNIIGKPCVLIDQIDWVDTEPLAAKRKEFEWTLQLEEEEE